MLAHCSARCSASTPTASIPTDNPFYNQTTGKNRAIWAYGLRNPFTMDVQPGTGRMFVNDVGASKWEEINELQRGANYGWPGSEGPDDQPRLHNPVLRLRPRRRRSRRLGHHRRRVLQPRQRHLPRRLRRRLLLRRLRPRRRSSGSTPTRRSSATSSATSTRSPTSRSAPTAPLYYLQRFTGRLVRVQSTTNNAPTISAHPESQTVAVGQPVTFTVGANGANLSYQWQRNGGNIAGATSASYTIDATDAERRRRRVPRDRLQLRRQRHQQRRDADRARTTPPRPRPSPRPPRHALDRRRARSPSPAPGPTPRTATCPPAPFTWRVDLHHDTHTHPFIAPFSGVTSGTFAIPTTGHDAEHNIWYRIHLTVTDSDGISHSTFRDVFPQKVNLSLAHRAGGAVAQPRRRARRDALRLARRRRLPTVARRPGDADAQRRRLRVRRLDRRRRPRGARHRHPRRPTSPTPPATRSRRSSTQSVTLRAAADAYVRDGSYAGQNFGTSAELQLEEPAPPAGTARPT